MALLLSHTFAFSCLPRGLWPLIRVLLITKALKEDACMGAHSDSDRICVGVLEVRTVRIKGQSKTLLQKKKEIT